MYELLVLLININPFKIVNGYLQLLLNSENPLRCSQSHGSEIRDQCYTGSQEIPTCSRVRPLSMALVGYLRQWFWSMAQLCFPFDYLTDSA